MDDTKKIKVAPPLESPDLEKARDEKCIPIARAIFGDMVNTLIAEDASKEIDYNPLVKSILTKMLEADTNLLTENTYIFQLLLGVFSGLNRTVQMCETVQIDDVRYGNIARKILEIVAKHNVTIGNPTPDEVDKDFAPIKEELDVLFANEKLTIMEVKYIMDNIFTGFSDVQTIFNMSIEQSTKRAEAKSFGIEDMTDLSMKKLDGFLKS